MLHFIITFMHEKRFIGSLELGILRCKAIIALSLESMRFLVSSFMNEEDLKSIIEDHLCTIKVCATSTQSSSPECISQNC